MSADAGPALVVEGVHKSFGDTSACHDVSLTVAPGEFVSLLGPSGCGKTTLLRVIAGLETPDSGSIGLLGRDITRVPTSRRGCAIVFQSYALFPNLTAIANVAYGLDRRSTSRADRTKRAMEQLDLVGLADLADRFPAQLSGGQQQRVALARALAIEPSLLLLDEPLSALDARVRVRLRQEIRDLQRRLGVATVMVTHDQEEALTMADRVLVMNRGRLVQSAAPIDVYHRPTDSFVADFVGSMNFLGSWRSEGRDEIRRGPVLLRTVEGALERHRGSRVDVAIRPEDVRLLAASAPAPNTFPATVVRTEFRGSFHRYRIRFGGGQGSEGLTVDVDLQSHAARELDLVETGELAIRLPPEALHLFPSDGPLDS